MTEALSSVDYELESEAFAGLDARVSALTVYEALSEPYGAELAVTVADPDFDAASALGKNAALTITRQNGLPRRLTGIVREVRDGEQASGERQVEGASRMRIVVVPALWMLSRRRDTRIFQDKSVPEILDEVLGGALGPYGRATRSALSASYPAREHCVQYQESDLDFAHRLMEEEGIFYTFDHEGEVEVMVLMDRNDACERVESPEGGLVAYQPHNMVVRVAEPVHLVDRRHRTTPTSAVISEWDWTRATMPFQHAQRGQDALGRDRERYEHGEGHSLTLHRYAGMSYGAEDGTTQKRVRLEAHTRDAITIEGVGRVTGFAPGKTFELIGHPTLGMDGEYLVVRVVHQNEAAEPLLGGGAHEASEHYHNRFECVPLATPFRPRRAAQKPRIAGVQTAVVTGPGGEEIHVDEHGRIKVQFHWDRLGARDDKSSCWIRVEQAWAGSGWGFWYVPRVGMEVVVQFVDGDPDRPLVTGCVYDGANGTPYPLPDEKTKSTIKSNSSLGGNGFNEFRYEDRAGSEEIYTHAQRDYNEVVEHDHNTLVHHDQTNTVDRNQTQLIGKDQDETVHGNQKMTVGGDRAIHVKSSFDETVDDTETRHVVGDVDETFDANESRTVGGNVEEAIGGNETRTIDGSHDEQIGGSHSRTTSGNATRSITGARSQTVTGGISTTTPGCYNITATGGYKLTAPAGLKWVAPGGIQIAAPGGIFQTDTCYDWQGGRTSKTATQAISFFMLKNEVIGVAIGAVGVKLGATGTHCAVVKATGFHQTAQRLHQHGMSVYSKAVDMQINGWFNWCV